MLTTVIHPLQQCDGIEALHNVVKYTAEELRSGRLRSVREVEVSLILNGQVSRSILTIVMSDFADYPYIAVVIPVPEYLQEILRCR